MIRKVIQIADSTQLVSLPRKWALEHGIKKGDELEIEEQGDKILITKEKIATAPKTLEINITNLDKDSLIFLIRGLYIRGYDEIKFVFNKPLMPHHKADKPVKVLSVIHGEIARSSGLEIIQEKGNFCVIKKIADSSIKEFDSVLKRTFLLIIDTASDLYKGAKEGDFVLVETLEEKHNTITKLILYNLRLLNTKGYSDYKNTALLFHLISSLDMIIDILRNSARDLLERKIKPSSSGLIILDDIQKAIELYHDLYYNFSLEKAEDFSRARDEIINSIKKLSKQLTKEDIRLLVALEHCLEIFRNLFSTRVGMEY